MSIFSLKLDKNVMEFSLKISYWNIIFAISQKFRFDKFPSNFQVFIKICIKIYLHQLIQVIIFYDGKLKSKLR